MILDSTPDNVYETAKQYEIIILILIFFLLEYIIPFFILYFLSIYTLKARHILRRFILSKFNILKNLKEEEDKYKNIVKKHINIAVAICSGIVIIILFPYLKANDISLSEKFSYIVKGGGVLLFVTFLLEAFYSFRFNIIINKKYDINKNEFEVYILMNYFYKLILYLIIFLLSILVVKIWLFSIKIIIPINLHIYSLIMQTSDKYEEYSTLLKVLPQLKIAFSEILFPNTLKYFIAGYVITISIISLSYFYLIGWKTSIIWIVGIIISTFIGQFLILILHKVFGNNLSFLRSLSIVLTIFTFKHVFKLLENILNKN